MTDNDAPKQVLPWIILARHTAGGEAVSAGDRHGDAMVRDEQSNYPDEPFPGTKAIAHPDRARVLAALDDLISEASSGDFAEYGRGGGVAKARVALLALIFPEGDQ